MEGHWEQARDSKWLLRFDTRTGHCIFEGAFKAHYLHLTFSMLSEECHDGENRGVARLKCSGSHGQNLNSSSSGSRTDALNHYVGDGKYVSFQEPSAINWQCYLGPAF